VHTWDGGLHQAMVNHGAGWLMVDQRLKLADGFVSLFDSSERSTTKLPT
jgi:hypothetical protein